MVKTAQKILTNIYTPIIFFYLFFQISSKGLIFIELTKLIWSSKHFMTVAWMWIKYEPKDSFQVNKCARFSFNNKSPKSIKGRKVIGLPLLKAWVWSLDLILCEFDCTSSHIRQIRCCNILNIILTTKPSVVFQIRDVSGAAVKYLWMFLSTVFSTFQKIFKESPCSQSHYLMDIFEQCI